MNKEIDFLKGQRGTTFSKTKLAHTLKVGSIMVLLAYLLVVAAVFSYWFFLERQGVDINREIAAKKTKIESLKEVESLQVVLKQRLSTLDKFFLAQKGTTVDDLLAYIGQVSSQIEIKELKINENKVNLSGSATNILTLENFLQELKNENSSVLFSQVILSSLDRQEDGSYFFNLVLEVK